jgi:ABC-type multidrug transport system permease subunit
MLKRIFAVFRARNLEFVRDRATLAWNVVLPLVLIVGLAAVFGGDGRTQYTVGIFQESAATDADGHPFLDTRYVNFVAVDDLDVALKKIERHQLDLLVEFGGRDRYWVNADSPKGYFIEKALLQSASGADSGMQKQQISGEAVSYTDWVLPGILGMNMMFSCLFGVGYVVVRYRKNGFLKRLRATPLSSLEFIIAQVASRLVLIMTITVVVFMATHLLLDTRMEGSYLALFIVALLGATSLVSLGLAVAARVTSEELAGGLLNVINWPMMLLSGVWFSLEGAGDWVQSAAKIFPLTHILDAARAIMLDGATLLEIMPAVLILAAMSAVFLFVGAWTFRWGPD